MIIPRNSISLNDVVTKIIRYETSDISGGNNLLDVIPKDLIRLSSVISADSLKISGDNLVLRSDSDILLNALDESSRSEENSLCSEKSISVLDQIRRMANIENICLPLSGGMINVIDGLSTMTRTRQLVSEVFNFTGTLIVLSTFNELRPWPCPGGEIASDYFAHEELGEGLVSAYHVPVSANWNIIVDGNYTPGTSVTASCDLGEFSIGTLDWADEVIETQQGRGRHFGIQFKEAYPIVQLMRDLGLPGYHQDYWEYLEYGLRVEFNSWGDGRSILRFELNHDNIIGEIQDFSQWYLYPYYTFDNQEYPLSGPSHVYNDVITAERVMTDADYNVIKRWNTENKNDITDLSNVQQSILNTPFVRQDRDSGISGNVEFMKNVTFDESLRNIRLGTLQEFTTGWGGLVRIISREYLNTYSLRDVLDYMKHLGYDTGILGNLKVPYNVNTELSANCVSALKQFDEDDGIEVAYGAAILNIGSETIQDSYNIPEKLCVEVEPGCKNVLPVVQIGGDDDLFKSWSFGQYVYEFNIPDTVSKIGSYAFESVGTRAKIENINIPDSVSCIEDYAFRGSSIKNIRIPKNLKYIGEGALDMCLNEYGHEGEERCLSIYINEEIEHIGAYAFPSWDYRETETKLYWNSYNSPPADIDSKISPECMDETGVIRYPSDADSRNWPTTIAGFSCMVDPEFFLDESKRIVSNFYSMDRNVLVPRSYLDEKISELSSSYEEKISNLENLIMVLSGAISSIVPNPPVPTSGTFTWTDSEGEHTEYLSNLNNFQWTNSEGIHYYCTEHGVDNPECTEYQDLIHGGNPSLMYTNSNGTQTINGPMTLNWTNHEGTHSVSM